MANAFRPTHGAWGLVAAAVHLGSSDRPLALTMIAFDGDGSGGALCTPLMGTPLMGTPLVDARSSRVQTQDPSQPPGDEPRLGPSETSPSAALMVSCLGPRTLVAPAGLCAALPQPRTHRRRLDHGKGPACIRVRSELPPAECHHRAELAARLSNFIGCRRRPARAANARARPFVAASPRAASSSSFARVCRRSPLSHPRRVASRAIGHHRGRRR